MRGTSFLGGLYGGLPGSRQSVPRSELFAILALIRLAAPSAFLHVVTDSKITYDTYCSGFNDPKWRESPNADLWVCVWELCAARSGKCCVYWVKAHAAESEEMYRSYCPNPVHVVGNACADLLAGWGSLSVAVPSAVADQVLSSLSSVHVIQMRILAIMIPVIEDNPRAKRGPTLGLQLPAGNVALGSSHSLVAPGSSYCLLCGWGPRGAGRQRWLRSACVGRFSLAPSFRMVATQGAIVKGVCQTAGRVIHRSHNLHVSKGIFVCVRCGYLAASNVRKLQNPCLDIMSPNRASVLHRLQQGLLP